MVSDNKNWSFHKAWGSSEIFENRIDDEWLNSEKAARYLSITPNALRILVYRDKVRAFKFGRRLRFRFADLQKLLIKKGEN